jgi:hypothetical protein
MQEGASAGKVGALSVWRKEAGRMKATDRSPRVAELVALLAVKSDSHDPSPLGQLVARYLWRIGAQKTGVGIGRERRERASGAKQKPRLNEKRGFGFRWRSLRHERRLKFV